MEIRLYIDKYPLRTKDLPHTAKCATISSFSTVMSTAGTLNVTRTIEQMKDPVTRSAVAVPINYSNGKEEIAHCACASTRYRVSSRVRRWTLNHSPLCVYINGHYIRLVE